jgi:hypothetical protein
MARVVVNPLELRRGASRLRDASKELTVVARALAGVGLPEMPAGVAAQVEGGIASARARLDGNAPRLADGAVELERRALWAEIADRLDAGYPLTGTQLKEFVAWMKDGTLLRYATPHEAANAGRYLGVLYRGNFKHPDRLIELAQILRAGETWAEPEALREFSGAFVESFGAQNLVEVPRVIQAIEWSHVINGSFGPQERHVLDDVAREWGDRDLEQDPVDDLLAPFAIALANATYSGRLTRTTEDAVAHDEDTWATAQLLTKGTFGTHFLLECFRTGVVQKIVDHSRWDGTAAGLGEEPHDAPYSLGRFWEHGDHRGVAYDTKSIVLDALARNPEAARLALTTDLHGVQVYDRVGQQHAVTDPLALVYEHGDFDDDGAALGRVYVAATDHLNADRSDLASVRQGSELARTGLKEMLEHDRDGMSAFKDGLATDLARHHIGDLFTSAAVNQWEGWDTIGIGHAGDGSPLELSAPDLTETVRHLAERNSALTTLLDAGARHQAELIDEGTRYAPGSGHLAWASTIASFDAAVLNGTDLHRLDEFNAADARHQAVVGFFKSVVDGVVRIENPVAGAAAHSLIDKGFEDAFPGPSIEHVVEDDTRARSLMTNAFRAAVVTGYYDHGHMAHVEPPHGLASDGKLVSYGSLKGQALWDFSQWMHTNDDVRNVVEPALGQASDALSDRDIDLFR